MDVLHVDLSFKMLRSLYKHQKCSRKPDTMRFGSKFLCENLSHACWAFIARHFVLSAQKWYAT